MAAIDVSPTTLPSNPRNDWAPVLYDRTDTARRIDGTTPDVLQETCIRTGPHLASGRSERWFFGDGMLHGVRIAARRRVVGAMGRRVPLRRRSRADRMPRSTPVR